MKKLLRESKDREYQFRADIWDLIDKYPEFFGKDDTNVIFYDEENNEFHTWRLQGIDRDKLKKHILKQNGFKQSDMVESYDEEYESYSETYEKEI